MQKKEWTVLIYAASNNDLEATLYREFQSIKAVNLSDNINIVIQLSRSPQQELLKNHKISSEDWHGTRRYLIQNKDAVLLDDLGKVNMADPNTFLDFLIAGSSSFPSEYLMIILSGHSMGFVGIMLDSFENNVSLMSIQGFTRALSLFKERTKKEIDILFSDTCYMNLIEVLYEIAMASDGVVKYFILFQGNPPLESLPWSMIVNRFNLDKKYTKNLNNLVCDIVMSVNKKCSKDYSLFAIYLIKDYFLQLKTLINQLAEFILEGNHPAKNTLSRSCCNQKNSALVNLLNLFNILDESLYEVIQLRLNIFKILNKIVLSPSLKEIKNNESLGLCMYFPENPKQYFQFQNYYDPLLFCSHNRWLKILQKQ
ncbi:MAG: clostripain-related cysteine peptidase [Marinisporobacter sp.]|jgi:hypothetical protein|nr:clostripain-related cysteine peptidase [Marinisporobacter sp.]